MGYKMERGLGFMRIGIVGQGYVGTAIKVGFEPHYELETYDKYDKDKSTCDTLFDLVMECDVMFVCVPTPMNTDGSCHTDIVESVVKEIDDSININITKNIELIEKNITPTSENNTLSNLIIATLTILILVVFLTILGFLT